MAEINFCDNCNNLLFLYSNDKQKLFLGCKLCEFTKEYNDTNCIFTNEFNLNIDNVINYNKYLSDDITLPIIENNPNIICPNKDCPSIQEKKSKITYIKYNHDNLKFIYICKFCNQKWTNN